MTYEQRQSAILAGRFDGQLVGRYSTDASPLSVQSDRDYMRNKSFSLEGDHLELDGELGDQLDVDDGSDDEEDDDVRHVAMEPQNDPFPAVPRLQELTLTPEAGALSIDAVLRRAGLSDDQRRAVDPRRAAIIAYLAQASLYAADGLSLGDFVQSVHSDDAGVFPDSVSAHLGSKVSQDREFATAMQKLDDAIRQNYPRLCHHGLLRM